MRRHILIIIILSGNCDNTLNPVIVEPCTKNNIDFYQGQRDSKLHR